MATGAEIAGLALAVLPLVIEAAKAYSDGVDEIRNVVVKDRYDERLEVFYDAFYFALVDLEDCISRVCVAARASSTTFVNFISPTDLFSKGRLDAELDRNLRAYLGTEARVDQFTRISRRVLMLLEKVVDDRGARLSSTDTVGSAFLDMSRSLTDGQQSTQSRLA